MPFSSFNLHPELSKAAKALGFEKPTPIQEMAVPPALKGRDVLGSAQTGSGKTVAFALPLLNKLLTEPRARGSVDARALILTPVRELAQQIEAVLGDLTKFSKLKTTLVIGGAPMRAQTTALAAGVDVIVATPGRLLDHLRNTRGFHLRECRGLVLDEADRMLDMGFLPDVSAILMKIPVERQTLMFSATVPPEIERLVAQFMRDPQRIQIDPPRQPAEGVIQRVYPVSQTQKYDLLFALIESLDMDSTLIFTATRKRADIVANFLKSKKLTAASLHSDLSQSVRTQTMQGFRDQKYDILVATDIAARGLDIRHVSHVFNFDVPLYAEDYLHRIGRTARAFTIGDAITLMAPNEKAPIESIERFIGQPITRCALEGFPYDVPPRLKAFKSSIHSRFNMRRRSAVRGRRGIC